MRACVRSKQAGAGAVAVIHGGIAVLDPGTADRCAGSACLDTGIAVLDTGIACNLAASELRHAHLRQASHITYLYV